MKLIYNSRFQNIIYNEESSLLVVTRKPETDSMLDEDYKSELRVILDKVLTLEIKNVLIDERDFNFPIVPELQTWLATQIFPPAIQAGLTKLGFIKSSDLFVHVSIGQTMEEVRLGSLWVKYFDDEQEALAWIEEKVEVG